MANHTACRDVSIPVLSLPHRSYNGAGVGCAQLQVMKSLAYGQLFTAPTLKLLLMFGGSVLFNT